MAKDETVYQYLEKWNTRFGKSERVVLRQEGRFVDNYSVTALRKAQSVK